MAAIDLAPWMPRTATLSQPAWPVRQAIFVGLLALLLNLAGNGRVSLFDRDEPRYAGATRDESQRRLGPSDLQCRAPLSQAGA